jgi:hypothetical protein
MACVARVLEAMQQGCDTTVAFSLHSPSRILASISFSVGSSRSQPSGGGERFVLTLGMAAELV